MAAQGIYFLFLCGIISSMIASESEAWSGPSILDRITALDQEVLELKSFISSIPHTIQVANEEMLLHILEKMSGNSELHEAHRKEFQAQLSNHTLRIVQLEERVALCNDGAQVNQNLRNETFLIENLSQQLEDVQSLLACAGEPPSTQNGSPVDFERKHGSDVRYRCDPNFVLAENSTVRCHLGKWEGQPPVCSLPICTGEPPSPQNGSEIDFERNHGSGVRYRCDGNLVMTGNSTVRCHFGKWEGDPPLCTLPALLDPAFTLLARVAGFWSSYQFTVSCSSEESPQKIEFSRVLDTGSGGDLPTGSKTFSRGREAVLDLSSVQRSDRVGVYECWYERDGKRNQISFVIQAGDWLEWPQVATIGDTVQLDSHYFDRPLMKWLHNGERVPAWDGRGNVSIKGVRREDAGVYEWCKEGDRRGERRFYKLVVRGCPPSFFGEHCDKNCTTCYNGGVCHEQLRTCVCPPGFVGEQCEVACGENRVGPNCSESCERGYCSKQLFCKPDPYGCSCASGYRGAYCDFNCGKGQFGANCKETCHCASGSCDPYTGTCSGSCSKGWTGPSCQIPGEH